MSLKRDLALADHDAIYAELIDAHRGLDRDASAALNARLVLLLANHIGAADIVREALAVARKAVHAQGTEGTP